MFSACAGEVAAGVGVKEREDAEEKNDDDADDDEEDEEDDEDETEEEAEETAAEAGPAVAVVAAGGTMCVCVASSMDRSTIPPSPDPPAAAPVAAAAGAPKKLAMVRCFLDCAPLPLLGALPLVPIDPPPLLGRGESEPHIAHVDVSWSLRNVHAGQAHCSRPFDILHGMMHHQIQNPLRIRRKNQFEEFHSQLVCLGPLMKLGFALLALLSLAAVPGAGANGAVGGLLQAEHEQREWEQAEARVSPRGMGIFDDDDSDEDDDYDDDASMPDQDGGETIVLDYNQKQYGIGGGPMKLTDSEDPVDRAFGPFAASDLSSWPEGQYDRIAGAARALQTAVVAAHYSQPYVADAFGLTRWEAFPLDQLGNTQGANRLKRLQNLAAFIKGESPGRLRRGPQMTEKGRKRLVLFVRLFLMGIQVKAKAVVKALGSDIVRILMDDLGLLSYGGASKTMLVSNMQIAPVAEDLLITTDFIQRQKTSSLEPVMYIGLSFHI